MTLELAYFILYLFVFVVGSCIGSFLNVVIYRVPIGLSIAKGRSFCPQCHAKIAAYDNIPLISWLVLRGKCRHCGQPIPMRYFWVELSGGVAALWCAHHYDFGPMMVPAFAMAAILIAIALIDWEKMIIPNGLVVALIVPAVATYFLTGTPALTARLMGVFIVSLPLFCLGLMGAFGMGDVKLMAVSGFALGWQGSLLAVFIAILCGGAVGIFKLVVKTREREMAFGPYLCMGIFIALLYSSPIILSYLQFFGLK